MKLEEKRKEVIKFLRNYNHDSDDYKKWIVLAAPARSAQGKLRAYMNGGNVGKIALKEGGLTTGIKSKDYSHKCKVKVPEVVNGLDKNSGEGEWKRLEALTNSEYLEYVQEATATYSVKSDKKTDTERTIETLIMDFRNQQLFGNAAIDMEMQYSVKDFGWTKEKLADHEYRSTMIHRKHEWYNEEVFPDSGETIVPRVDLMVLNDNGIGFVELKVDNENCQNLSSHISHMNYILSHQDVFIKDANRRLSVLKEYELLEPEMNPNIEKWEKDQQIWCGILFVGEKEAKINDAKELVKKETDTQSIKFCFADTSVVKGRRLNMRSEAFVSDEEFLSSSYQGEI